MSNEVKWLSMRMKVEKEIEDNKKKMSKELLYFNQYVCVSMCGSVVSEIEKKNVEVDWMKNIFVKKKNNNWHPSLFCCVDVKNLTIMRFHCNVSLQQIRIIHFVSFFTISTTLALLARNTRKDEKEGQARRGKKLNFVLLIKLEND